MRVEIDGTRCAAFGNCVALAPDHFTLGESAPVRLRRATVPAEDLAAVEDAVDRCPTGALDMVED